ncbi:hypothetical protein HZQ32_03670 [Elizabethkingia anophelis]|uniref:FISUMP domain-containing protein n=1 Tax=Elizabethkingia anophelis TaxID=1117645 RepID=UPI0021A834DD|nr:hypothetical protein [Elizabethkingia anophelis]MCT3947630.1 hypothetical protein [Elizabethkingia anophelis]
MQKRRHSILALFIGSLSFLSFVSCRTTDPENSVDGLSGKSSLMVNVLGSAFLEGSGSEGLETQAIESNERSVMITPSSVIVSSQQPTSISGSTASVGGSGNLTPYASGGDPLTTGTSFRVIAYNSSDGSYATHQDYIVGSQPTPMMLNLGSTYTIVVYSYNMTTLPPIGNQTGNLSSATSLFYTGAKDFMYYSTTYTPTSASGNTLNITLRHKLSQIQTVLTSQVGTSQIASVLSASITPNFNDGTFSLATGNISGQSTQASASVAFNNTALPATSATSSYTLINGNTNGSLGGSFTANVTIGTTQKTISVPNSFTITPGYRTTLNINLVSCGAYLGAGNTNWKEFACYNLGANTSYNPFLPQSQIHGNKYQWGANSTPNFTSQLVDQGISGPIPGWGTQVAADNSWTDSKGTTDPCPTGYRVPSRAEWNAVVSFNSVTRLGTWTNSATNYISGIKYGNGLFLPAAGERNNSGGDLLNRGSNGYYWASTQDTNPTAFRLTFDNAGNNGTVAAVNRLYGFPVRCISQ